VRQLIKNILKEETEQDLSPAIKELLKASIGPKYKKVICTFDAIPPWKTATNSEDYQIMVSVVGGVGSKRWPRTQFVHRENDEIVDDVWKTVYNFMGLSTDVFLRNVKSCNEVLTESSNERLEKLIGDYISMSYPTAKKIRLAPPGANVEITTFTLPNPEDERDNFIIKFNAYGMPDYNIHPDFLNSIKSMFGGNKNIKKIILKWFDEKEIDEDLLQDSKKQEQNESELTERCWKGYTQKGMKTMFGKRYPNCVKAKK
jgi:hypothetical protein